MSLANWRMTEIDAKQRTQEMAASQAIAEATDGSAEREQAEFERDKADNELHAYDMWMSAYEYDLDPWEWPELDVQNVEKQPRDYR